MNSVRLFASAVILALAALVAPAEAQAPDKPFRVVTTFTVIQDIAQNIAGDKAIVESITKPGAEIHDYQPTPLDIVKAQAADLVLWNGFNLERWFERFFDNVQGGAGRRGHRGHRSDRHQRGPLHRQAQSACLDVAVECADLCREHPQSLVKFDPKNADTYNKNAADYSAKIKALDEPLRKRLAGIPDSQRWLVTSEGAFSYLTRDYKMKEAYLWPINADEQGTPKQVRKVIDLVRKNKIPVVFSESTISDRAAKQVARETGAKYGGALYVDSLSAANGPVPSYLDLLNVTVETIAKGFGK